MKNRIYNPVTRRMEVEGSEHHKPSYIAMANSLLDAAVNTVKRVAKGEEVLATDEVLAERKATCLECPQWNPRGWGGGGRCEACGCSGLKLTLAASQCPIGKWAR
jgi:hypothetical protein